MASMEDYGWWFERLYDKTLMVYKHHNPTVGFFFLIILQAALGI